MASPPKRFKIARGILDPGAGNPSGICHAILEACDELREDPNHSTKKICEDVAVRLMVYQLSAICGVALIEQDHNRFNELWRECLREASKGD